MKRIAPTLLVAVAFLAWTAGFDPGRTGRMAKVAAVAAGRAVIAMTSPPTLRGQLENPLRAKVDQLTMVGSGLRSKNDHRRAETVGSLVGPQIVSEAMGVASGYEAKAPNLSKGPLYAKRPSYHGGLPLSPVRPHKPVSSPWSSRHQLSGGAPAGLWTIPLPTAGG